MLLSIFLVMCMSKDVCFRKDALYCIMSAAYDNDVLQ